ncbi:uncharacterized protein Bfra_002181 [Botrytis fragariae]|uniref:Uncharacterized protein n=1 Tax=Botrytis fragariae TaxID=1964551 RepID=A0A8H6B1Q6_9HELO|nr:uncharacterized protein Bfra_002181 [Botrytis fragariae]KAF5877811.1 hypothetical protein Bfra_002181 [Botrytis fragariae]
MMNGMSIPKASTGAPSSTTPSAQELRQQLLAQIFEYNTDVNTPSELRIHVTGLTLEEGAIFERDASPGIRNPRIQTPANAPREGLTSLRNATLDIKSSPPKDSTTTLEREASKSRELTHWRDAKIKLRDLQREKETLEMEGRRRAAKEQIDARWQDRALKDFKENKAEIKYDIVPGVDGSDKVVITDVQYPKSVSGTGGVLSGNAIDERIKYNIRHDEDSLRKSLIDIINGESVRQNRKTTSNRRRRSPKIPTGTRQLAESRRKLDKEWVASEGHRRAIRQDDESTRKNLLKGVNRAIATAEEMVLKGAEQLIDFVNGDQAWENTTEVVYDNKNKDSRLRDESPLAYARLGYSSPFSARNEPESKSRGGNRYAHELLVSEERERTAYTEGTSPPFQAHMKRALPRARANTQAHSGGLPEPPRREKLYGGNYIPEKDGSPQAFRSTQEEKDRPFVYRPRENIQIPPMSPLAPKVTQPQRRSNSKLEHLPVVFPVPTIRDSCLLPSESPAQGKIRTQREEAHAKFEREKSKYQGEVETAKKKEQASPKGILSRDGKGKGKGIAWADKPIDFKEDDMPSMGKTLSFNQRADQEELRRLQEKRATREGQYKCHATESTIERENLAAWEKAKALAEKLMRGGGGSEDQRDPRAGK